MADNLFEQPDNATPLRPEEADALRVPVVDRRQLNEIEAANVAEGRAWALRSRRDCFTDGYFCELHRRMLVGIQIRDQKEIKLFRFGKNPILRGTALVEHERLAHLWTRGYVPRLETYPGREVPNPLTVEIRQGDADIEQVLRDVLALTKVNFNNAQFADGLPVTLRFADQIGEILTAGPSVTDAPLPFKFYI